MNFGLGVTVWASGWDGGDGLLPFFFAKREIGTLGAGLLCYFYFF
jgi:hypothetical protein